MAIRTGIKYLIDNSEATDSFQETKLYPRKITVTVMEEQLGGPRLNLDAVWLDGKLQLQLSKDRTRDWLKAVTDRLERGPSLKIIMKLNCYVTSLIFHTKLTVVL